MQSMIMTLPILPGKTEALKEMFREIKEERWADYQRVQNSQGITKERDFLQETPTGDFFLIYIESEDIKKTFNIFTYSKDPFDLWYIQKMKEITGVDLSKPSSELLPQLLLAHE